MIREIAARRYGEAAFQIARDGGTEERWSEGLSLMAAIFSDSEIAALMQEARISTADKMGLAEKALAGVDPLVLNLARLLVHRGRTALASQIAEAFQELVDAERGIAHALVTTAVPLSDDETRAVAEKLSEISDQQVVVETQVDERIIGGLVARIGDKLIDGSTRSRLLALKRRLREARA
ncbi:MAG: ATP synthase F1 subunit delta [Chloroflexi bacterium]|nr:ATP synthase F1 subunit delta [Chloroflexota bacterium]